MFLIDEHMSPVSEQCGKWVWLTGSLWQNNMPLQWITFVSNQRQGSCWHVQVSKSLCMVFMHLPQPEQPWVSIFNLSHSEVQFIVIFLWPGFREVVCEVVMAVQEHMSIKPGFPWTWARQGWNGSVSRAGRGQAGGWIREGYTNVSWQRRLFSSNTQVHAQTHIYKHMQLLWLLVCTWSLTHTHIQTSSWHRCEAVSDEIKWSRGTSLLCYKSLLLCYSVWMLFHF